jgi:hypothetical protein
MATVEFVEFVASHSFTRQATNGTTVEWHQEDESAVTCKAEAVAIVQRTIDFWLPMLADNIQHRQQVSRTEAERQSLEIFRTQFTVMITTPFCPPVAAMRRGFYVQPVGAEVARKVAIAHWRMAGASEPAPLWPPPWFQASTRVCGTGIALSYTACGTSHGKPSLPYVPLRVMLWPKARHAPIMK